ncbi:peroxisomal membrane protein 13 [Iris pallida]|uniref:Peroxin-13 n=1 Tax=Iris pallida TaxID=29817 RepID=A0AAX6G820_IRIPA|nr:peroxisomal membrane protein 13 [Iris pallida]
MVLPSFDLPPSSGNTSEIVEASGTAKPGEIVSNDNASANRQNTLGRPVPSRPWEQNNGNSYGGYGSNLNYNSGYGSGMYGGSYGGLGGTYGGGLYGNSMYRGGYGGLYGGSGMYGGGMYNSGFGGQMGEWAWVVHMVIRIPITRTVPLHRRQDSGYPTFE